MIGLRFFQLIHTASGSQIGYLTRILRIWYIYCSVHGLIVIVQVAVICTDIQVLHYIETCFESRGKLIPLVFILMFSISKNSSHAIQNSRIAQRSQIHRTAIRINGYKARQCMIHRSIEVVINTR